MEENSAKRLSGAEDRHALGFWVLFAADYERIWCRRKKVCINGYLTV
jgi:hypothetical protein